MPTIAPERIAIVSEFASDTSYTGAEAIAAALADHLTVEGFKQGDPTVLQVIGGNTTRATRDDRAMGLIRSQATLASAIASRTPNVTVVRNPGVILPGTSDMLSAIELENMHRDRAANHADRRISIISIMSAQALAHLVGEGDVVGGAAFIATTDPNCTTSVREWRQVADSNQASILPRNLHPAAHIL